MTPWTMVKLQVALYLLTYKMIPVLFSYKFIVHYSVEQEHVSSIYTLLSEEEISGGDCNLIWYAIISSEAPPARLKHRDIG